MIRKGLPLLAVFLLLIPGISRGALVHEFEAGITNDGSIVETTGFLLDGVPYSWSFNFTSNAPIPGEGGEGNPDLQAGFYGARVSGWHRLSESFPVPEASVLMLLGTGLVGLVVWRRRKRFE